MRVYFSGIGGVGIGPLAEIAHDAGYDVVGSDMALSPIVTQLQARGVEAHIGQDGSQIAHAHDTTPIDWFVYTSALPADHPELVFAKNRGIRTSKRDDFLASFIAEKGLKLIAIAGTHGKTTTTGLMVWVLKQLGGPISYSVGTSVNWGPSGQYNPDSRYFVYECDEYDRNFLHFEPSISVITALDYDHADTYTAVDDYKAAFRQFIQQSAYAFLWEKDRRYLGDFDADYEAFDELMDLSHFTLAGDHVRHNAFLVQKALEKMMSQKNEDFADSTIIEAINSFPGTSRRFEKLADNLYSDYGHHPSEIAATLQMAHELSNHVTLVYQPHQNIRQHEIRDDYTDEVFAYADEIYWLPTYLSREDPQLEILTPEQLSSQITGDKVHTVDMDDTLWDTIQRHRDAGHLVLVMGAGSIDTWIRQQWAIKKVANILITDRDNNFVLHQRDNNPGITNPGLITAFGGSVEENETEREAALRELHEETNLVANNDDLKYFVTLFQETINDGTSRWVTYYILENQDVSKLEVYEGEGFKIIAPNDLNNHKLSDMAQKATSFYLTK